MNERTDAIIKFSTVTGQKVSAATKGLTTAIQNGLVSCVEEAMDVMVALGDSAATTAEEIEKGMQKSAAAAANAGVSYSELTTMLTIATSKTQMSGQTAGTCFQTLFSRMNRVTKSGYANDEEGNTTSINDVEAALKVAGISLRTSDGKSIRNNVEVLRDLAKVWEDLNDLQKGTITYAMAGGRQANMFQTLMQGLSENGGKDFEQLLGIAEGSEGVTQSKYEIIIEGINAKMQELKATFDSIVENINSSGITSMGLDFLTNILQGFNGLTKVMGGLPAIAAAVGAAIVAMAVKVKVAQTVMSPIASIL